MSERISCETRVGNSHSLSTAAGNKSWLVAVATAARSSAAMQSHDRYRYRCQRRPTSGRFRHRCSPGAPSTLTCSCRHPIFGPAGLGAGRTIPAASARLLPLPTPPTSTLFDMSATPTPADIFATPMPPGLVPPNELSHPVPAQLRPLAELVARVPGGGASDAASARGTRPTGAGGCVAGGSCCCGAGPGRLWTGAGFGAALRWGRVWFGSVIDAE